MRLAPGVNMMSCDVGNMTNKNLEYVAIKQRNVFLVTGTQQFITMNANASLLIQGIAVVCDKQVFASLNILYS